MKCHTLESGRNHIKPALYTVVCMTMIWAQRTSAQIYTPFTGFPGGGPPPLLYNQFTTAAINGSPGPGANATSGTPPYPATQATVPFSYTRTVNNGATFNSFVGQVTATESVNVTTIANYGILTVDASAVATSSFSTALFGDYTVAPAGQQIVEFIDAFMMTPTSNAPAGTPVSVTFTEGFQQPLLQPPLTIIGSSPDTTAELVGTLQVTGDGVSLEAYFGQSFVAGQGFYTPLPSYPPGYSHGDATSFSTNLTLLVGTNYTIVGGISAAGQASAESDFSEGTSDATNAVIESATTQLYIDPAGVGYTTASGTVYPLPPPVLHIRLLANHGVVLFWPSEYTNFVLQQNPGFAPANWTLNTSNIFAANGTNEVTILPANGNVYFRLVGQ